MSSDKKTLTDVVQEKSQRMMNAIARATAFYRSNPHRFCKDYLNIQLKTFQKLLIFMMIRSTNFLCIASRGIGKSWLTALYCVVRCILFPGSKIVIASGVKSQSITVIEKIEKEFLKNYGWGSANLKNEILYISTSMNGAGVDFKNGSFIKIVTSSSNARSNRANIIVVDEYRLVDPDVINTVLRRFLTAPRTPGYLNKPEYSHLVERNSEIYLSSAWYKAHWSYEKFKTYFANMLDDTKNYFCVAIPYQCAIKYNLLSREQLIDEMSEIDHDPVAFSMEMESLFFGSSDGAFFRYDDIAPLRKLKNAFYPLDVYKNHRMRAPELSPNERRILSVDVALMSSKKSSNDASALIINSCIQNEKESYTNNIVYLESHEGLNTDELGLIVMRTFYQYNCTDLVLDCNGVGLGVYDSIIKNTYDPDYGVEYSALCCCNDDVMRERCHVPTAKRVVWSIKATAEFNTKAATGLRAALQNRNINLLISEADCEEVIKKIRGYDSMTPYEQTILKVPYLQTSLLINELINLEHEIRGNNIKLFERSGMRKDRFSSLEYNIEVAREIYTKKRQVVESNSLVNLLPIRSAKSFKQF